MAIKLAIRSGKRKQQLQDGAGDTRRRGNSSAKILNWWLDLMTSGRHNAALKRSIANVIPPALGEGEEAEERRREREGEGERERERALWW